MAVVVYKQKLKIPFDLNAVHLTVGGEPIEPPVIGIKPFDKPKANGILFK